MCYKQVYVIILSAAFYSVQYLWAHLCVTLQSKFWCTKCRMWLFIDNFGAWKLPMYVGLWKSLKSPWIWSFECAMNSVKYPYLFTYILRHTKSILWHFQAYLGRLVPDQSHSICMFVHDEYGLCWISLKTKGNKFAQSNLGRGPRCGTVAHVCHKVPIGYNGAPQIRPQKYLFPWTDLQTTLPASSLDLSDLWCQTASGSDLPFFHSALDRPTYGRTYGPTDRPRESLITIGHCATRATCPNNAYYYLSHCVVFRHVKFFQKNQMFRMLSVRWQSAEMFMDSFMICWSCSRLEESHQTQTISSWATMSTAAITVLKQSHCLWHLRFILCFCYLRLAFCWASCVIGRHLDLVANHNMHFCLESC